MLAGLAGANASVRPMCDDRPHMSTSDRSPTGAQPRRDPLEGIERLIIDGSNLLYALRHGPNPAPPATLIGRLRGTIPPGVRIELVLDGPPERGLVNARVASGVLVRHSGHSSGDALIAQLVGLADQISQGAPEILVVTDDHDLKREARRRGAATIGADWLVRRLDRTRIVAPSAGRPGRPPAAAGTAHAGGQDRSGRTSSRAGGLPGTAPGGTETSASSTSPQGWDDVDDSPERTGWRPGRGATAKKGNPFRRKRGPSSARER